MNILIKIFFVSLVSCSNLFSVTGLVKANSNVREKPSFDSKTIAWAKKDTVHEIEYIVESKNAKEWAKIPKGFIALSLLKVKDKSKVKVLKSIKYLSRTELEKLFIGRTRIGKTRYSQNGSFFKSRFNEDGSVFTSLYTKEGKKVSDYRMGRWSFHDNGSFCVSQSIKKSKVSCRRVVKDKNAYISVLESDGKFFSKFIVK